MYYLPYTLKKEKRSSISLSPHIYLLFQLIPTKILRVLLKPPIAIPSLSQRLISFSYLRGIEIPVFLSPSVRAFFNQELVRIRLLNKHSRGVFIHGHNSAIEVVVIIQAKVSTLILTLF